jgi:putative ABC transport system substrate-binding protein
MRAARGVLAVAVACALFAAASPATAQPASRSPLVGFLPLGSESNAYDRSLVEAFRQGLREAGFVEGRDVQLEVVWTNNELEVLPAALGLVQRGAKVLIRSGPPPRWP